MPEDTSLLVDLAVWAALVATFTAYTSNVTKTTRELGGRIATSTQNAAKMMTVITPRWQTRNIVIMFSLIVIYLGVCFYILTWYLAIASFLVTVLIANPIISRLLPRPMSQFIVSRIYRALQKRGEEFEASGDHARALACSDAIDLLDSRGGVSADDPGGK